MVRLTRRARPGADLAHTSQIDERQVRQFQEFKAELTGRKGEAAVADALRALGKPALHDVILPDHAGLTQIDHLVLADRAVLVLETKTYGGTITGSVEDYDWHQHLKDGAVRTAFLNPLRQNFRHVRAVERLVQSIGSAIAIQGHVVSAGRADYAPQIRDSVVMLPAMADLFPREPASPAETGELRRVWAFLAEVAARHESRRDEHRSGLAERKATTPWGV